MLSVTEVIVPAGEIWRYCADGMRWYQRVMLSVPVACARIDFSSGRCWIIITETTPASTRQHEQMHCEGWDHDGVLAAGWARYRAASSSTLRVGQCEAPDRAERATC